MDSRTEFYQKVAKKVFSKYPGCINAVKVVVLPITHDATKKQVDETVSIYVGNMIEWSKVRKEFPTLEVNYNSYTHPLKPGRMVVINFQTSLSEN